MKRISLLIFFGILCACSSQKLESDPPGGGNGGGQEVFLDIQNNQLVLNEKAGNITKTSLNCNTDWTISLLDSRGVPTWLTVHPLSGTAGVTELTVTASEANPDYDDRNAIIQIKAGNVIKNLTVTQKKKDAILLSADKIELELEDDGFSIDIESNVSYEVFIPENSSWITHSIQPKSKGLKESTEHFTVLAPTENGKRQGEVIFRSGEVEETLQVFQVQKDVLILVDSELFVFEEGNESLEVALKTNIDYDIIIPVEDQKWISVIPAELRILRTDKIYFKIEPNPDQNDRQSVITISDKSSNQTQELTVIQNGRGNFVLSPKEYEFDAMGGDFLLIFREGNEYEISIPSEIQWITRIPESALRTKIGVSRNDTYLDREAEIIVTQKETGKTLKISINQKRIYFLTAEQTSFVVNENGENVSISLEANFDIQYQLSDADSEWIEIKDYNINSTEYCFIVDVKANTTGAQREANIEFFGVEPMNKRVVVTLRQATRGTGIYTVEDLRTLAEELNKQSSEREYATLSKYGLYNSSTKKWTFTLRNDIELNPETIFKDNGEYSGAVPLPWQSIDRFADIFDGNGFSINGFYNNVSGGSAGFVNILDGGRIQNLTIGSGNIIAYNTIAGSIANSMYSGTITECTNHANLFAYESTTGGIIGTTYGGSVIGCENYGQVRSNGHCLIGGIVGDSSRGPVIGCINYGNLYATGGVGGICGYSTVQISACYNEGEIEIDWNNDVKNPYAGGVVGCMNRVDGTQRAISYLISCYNAGKITIVKNELESRNICGVVGYLLYNGQHYEQVRSCYNMGDVPYYSIARVTNMYFVDNIVNCYYLSGKGIGGAGSSSIATEAEIQQISSNLNKALSSSSDYIYYDVPGEYPKLKPRN